MMELKLFQLRWMLAFDKVETIDYIQKSAHRPFESGCLLVNLVIR